jgi:hypothetical protein
MYANLKVRLEKDGRQREVSAWQIAAGVNDDETIVHVDGNDGNGNYAEPAGEISLYRGNGDRLLNVQADF